MKWYSCSCSIRQQLTNQVKVLVYAWVRVRKCENLGHISLHATTSSVSSVPLCFSSPRFLLSSKVNSFARSRISETQRHRDHRGTRRHFVILERNTAGVRREVSNLEVLIWTISSANRLAGMYVARENSGMI